MNDESVLLVPGHEVTPEALPKSPFGVFMLAYEHGWDVKAGHSKFRDAAVLYVDGDRKGDVRKPAKDVEMHWIQGVHPKRHITFDFVWHDNEPANGRINRYQNVNVTTLKKIIKGEEPS